MSARRAPVLLRRRTLFFVRRIRSFSRPASRATDQAQTDRRADRRLAVVDVSIGPAPSFDSVLRFSGRPDATATRQKSGTSSELMHREKRRAARAEDAVAGERCAELRISHSNHAKSRHLAMSGCRLRGHPRLFISHRAGAVVAAAEEAALARDGGPKRTDKSFHVARAMCRPFAVFVSFFPFFFPIAQPAPAAASGCCL